VSVPAQDQVIHQFSGVVFFVLWNLGFVGEIRSSRLRLARLYDTIYNNILKDKKKESANY
jgi:hypothetical protein